MARTAVRPFRINIPEEELVDLRRRILATRGPDKETGADRSQGVPLATMQELARYWTTEYDWRTCEAKPGVSGACIYWENKFSYFNAKNHSVPTAVSVFPGEQYQAPRSWTERAYPKLIYATGSTRAATSRPGNSRSSSPRSSGRRSDRCAHRGQQPSSNIGGHHDWSEP